MGSFEGHLVPGAFFIIFPLWWIYSIFRRYYIATKFHHNGTDGYRSTIAFPCHINSKRIHIEGYLKVISTIIGITGETATAFENGHWEHLGNAQHITMFAFFGISGIIDILTYRKCKALPCDLDYAAGFLAFAAEGFLFFNHLHGRTPMDYQVHMLLFCAIVGCALSVLFEAQNRKNVVAALSRAYFTLLQGTWFFQVGFILYPPFSFLKEWDENSHSQMMIITLLFTWHAVTHIVIILCAAAWIKSHVDKMENAEEEFFSWADNSDPLYSKLNSMDNQWVGLYKDNVEEPGSSKINGKNKSEVSDSDLEAM